MPRLSQRVRSQRGAALLEMALTLPLLLLVCVGILEFGRAYQTWQVITNAAREGARIAVLPGMDDTAVRSRVQQYMTIGQLPQAASATIAIVRSPFMDPPLFTAHVSRVPHSGQEITQCPPAMPAL